jgi:hypothetical protein
MNRFLHEVLDLTSAIILTVLFCNENFILLLEELPPTQKNYSIFHYGKITLVLVTLVVHLTDSNIWEWSRGKMSFRKENFSTRSTTNPTWYAWN